MNRVLLAIGGLLVGLFAILFVVPTMVDWNRYRGIFEEEASRFLGREVRVGGRVNLRLLPVPYVQFERVRVADTMATVGRPLFMAEEFTIWLSIQALLSGGLEASNIELRRPVVTLVLDGKGGGNWASLAPDKFEGSFVPAKVAFDAVRITNGTVAILAPDGTPKASFENINGDLSAQALDGPYRIAAAFASDGTPREIRLSTAKAAADGSVRFKGTIRDPASGVSYSLDGSASSVLSKVQVAGQLTARLPLPAAMIAQAPGMQGSQAGSEFDLRAELKGDTAGFTLSELALSFEQDGRPQIANGEAKVVWSERTDVSVALKSSWLDLDRIAGAGKGVSPLELAQGVATSVSRVLASEGRTEASLSIEQATLGGDVVSNLVATLEQNQRQLNIKRLAAALPGGARLVTSGAFEGSQSGSRYIGRIDLRGASLARFSAWAGRGTSVALPTRDAAFSVVGDVALGSKEISGQHLTIDIGRNTLTGELNWKAGAPQQIALNFEGSEFDLTPLVPGEAEPVQALRELIAGLAGIKGANAAVGATDADIRLHVDRLVVGATTFLDAVAELKLAAGNLTVPQLRLVSAEGYAVEVRGDIANLARPAAKGTLTWLLTADTAAGAGALARVAGLPGDLVPSDKDAELLVPLRLAGRLQVGSKGPDSQELAVDGTLAHTRIAGTLRLGAHKASWRDRPADIALTLEGPGVARLLARGAGGLAANPPSQASGGDGDRLVLRAIGTTKGGMTSLAVVESEGARAEYRGRASLDDDGRLGLDGELTMSIAELGRALGLAQIVHRTGLRGSVDGSVKVERNADRLKLSAAGLRIAGIETSGTIAIEAATRGVYPVSGDLRLDQGSLPGFFALLTATQAAGRRSAERGSASVWSEGALDLAMLDRLAGSRLRMELARLALAPGLDVTEARVELAVKPGSLDIKLSESRALGGQVAGSLVLEKAAAGVRVVANGLLNGLKLERLSPAGGQPTVAGGLSGHVKAESTALSPRGLIVALSGSGEVLLSQARLNRWNPGAIGLAADAVLSAKGEIQPGSLRPQLELALQASGVGLGSPKLTVTLADGALRTAPLVLNVPNGRLTGRVAIDLDQLLIDGDWRIEPRNTPQPPGLSTRSEYPGVTVAYSGPLALVTGLEPKLDIEALEREVAVRKVEREVLELERLRKLDEERRRQDAERALSERSQAGDQPPASGPIPRPAPRTEPAPGETAVPVTAEKATTPDAASAPVPGGANLPPAPAEKSPERVPAARPAQSNVPAKGGKTDPFFRLREGSP